MRASRCSRGTRRAIARTCASRRAGYSVISTPAPSRRSRRWRKCGNCLRRRSASSRPPSWTASRRCAASRRAANGASLEPPLMRGLFWLIAVFAAAVAFALAGRLGEGYVLVVYPPWRVEISMLLWVLALAAAFAVAYVTLRLVNHTLALPDQ